MSKLARCLVTMIFNYAASQKRCDCIQLDSARHPGVRPFSRSFRSLWIQMLLDALKQGPRSFCTDGALSDGHYSFCPGHVNQDCGRIGHSTGDTKGVNSLPSAHDFRSCATYLPAPPSHLSRDGLLKGKPIGKDIFRHKFS